MSGPVLDDGVEGPGGWKAWLVWGTAALFYLYEFFVRTAPSVMESELQESFQLTAGALGGVLGVYFYIYSPMQLLVGPALDRLSAKGVLVPAALFCAAGCFIEVLGHTGMALGMARFLQGFGSAFAFVGTMYLATQWFPRRQLALLSGLTTSLGMLGAIAANAGIAQVVQTLGWRITLWGAGFAGLVVAALLLFLVPHHAPTHVAAELGKPVRLGMLAGLRVVLSNFQTWLVAIVATALYMPLSVLGALWGVEYISVLTGEDKVQASGAVSMLYVGWLIGGPFCGWLSDWIGHRRLLLFASGVLTVLLTGLLLMFSRMGIVEVYVLMLAIGLGSSSQVVSFVVAVEQNPRPVSGTSIAVTNMFVMLLGGIGMALFGVILDEATGPGPLIHGAEYPIAAYRIAMILLPATALFGTLCAFILHESIERKLPDFAEPMG